jgi:ATP-dependent Clp protease ATP-binding subunit ClpA
MLERFTKRARSAVEAATAHARESTATETRPEHLLAALLDDEASLAVRVLADVGAPLSRLREELARHSSRYVDGLDEDDARALRVIGIDLDEVVRRIDRNLSAGRRGAGPRRPRFSRSSKKVLELALREALALRHNHIGTEHLLLGLARVEDRVVADTLRGVGIEPSRLRPAVVDALRRVG